MVGDAMVAAAMVAAAMVGLINTNNKAKLICKLAIF